MMKPKINSSFRRIEKRFLSKLSLGGGGGGGEKKKKKLKKKKKPKKGDRFYYITFNTYFARFILVFFKVSEIF